MRIFGFHLDEVALLRASIDMLLIGATWRVSGGNTLVLAFVLLWVLYSNGIEYQKAKKDAEYFAWEISNGKVKVNKYAYMYKIKPHSLLEIRLKRYLGDSHD